MAFECRLLSFTFIVVLVMLRFLSCNGAHGQNHVSYSFSRTRYKLCDAMYLFELPDIIRLLKLTNIALLIDAIIVLYLNKS